MPTSNFPWFTDLTFQVPIKYSSLQSQTLLSSIRQIHNWLSFSLWLSLFIPFGALSLLFSGSILDTYWPGWGEGLSSFSAVYFCLFLLFMVFSRQECSRGLHSFLPWTKFCQNSPPWPVNLSWPCKAWVIGSLICPSLWSIRSFWLASCDCRFHSDCPLMGKDKRLVQASWWVGLCSLPVVWPEAQLC